MTWQIATVADAETGAIAYYCIFKPPAAPLVKPGHQVSQVETLDKRLGAPVMVWAHEVVVRGVPIPDAPNVVQVLLQAPAGDVVDGFFAGVGE